MLLRSCRSSCRRGGEGGEGVGGGEAAEGAATSRRAVLTLQLQRGGKEGTGR